MLEARTQITRQVLEGLVLRKVLTSAVAEAKITVTDEEMDEVLEQIKSTLPPGTTLEQVLKERNLDETEFKNNLRQEIQVRKLIEAQVTSLPEPTEQEVKTFYEANKDKPGISTPEMVKARHILVATDPDDTEEARKTKKAKADSLHKKLVVGADFAKLASENSDDPGSKTRGGELEPFARGMMVKSFEDTAFSLKPNEISAVVESPFGYHIIQVSEHMPATYEIREEIKRFLQGQKQQETAQGYIEKLKEKASITYPEPL